METPLSGSHLGPHCKRLWRSVQQARLQRSSLFLVHALPRRLLFLQPQFTTETFDDEYKYSLSKRGSPFKGLAILGQLRQCLNEATEFCWVIAKAGLGVRRTACHPLGAKGGVFFVRHPVIAVIRVP